MSSNLFQHIRTNMETKSTEYLIKIWEENDREEWAEDAFEAIEQILKERGEALPLQKYSAPPAQLKKKKGKVWFIFVSLKLIILVGVIAHYTIEYKNNQKTKETVETMMASTSTTDSPSGWHEIMRWEGRGGKIGTFHIPSDEWRILWKTTRGEYDFFISVYNSHGRNIETIANTITKGADIDYMRGSGDYGIDISTSPGNPYTVVVQAKY